MSLMSTATWTHFSRFHCTRAPWMANSTLSASTTKAVFPYCDWLLAVAVTVSKMWWWQIEWDFVVPKDSLHFITNALGWIVAIFALESITTAQEADILE